MKFKFSCPHCQAAINASSEYVDREAKCPSCQQTLQVPRPPKPTADSPPVQATLLPEPSRSLSVAESNPQTPLNHASNATTPNPFAEAQTESVPVSVSGVAAEPSVSVRSSREPPAAERSAVESEANPYASPKSIEQIVVDAFGSSVSLHKVATGLQFVYWGLAVTVLGALVGSNILRVADDRSTVAIGVLVSDGGSIIGALLGLVGRCLCMAIPAHTGARGLILTAVIFDIASTTSGLLSSGVSDVPLFIPRLGSLCPLIASLLFLFFLQRVSGFIKRQDLQQRAGSLLALSFVFFGTLVFCVIAAQIDPLFSMVGVLSVVVVGFIVLLRYARLLVDLRGGILQLGQASPETH